MSNINATTKVIKKIGNPKVFKAKAAKPIEKKVWAELTLAACLKSIKTASHLSSRSVNSNAAAVGVRLDPSQRLPLPFVAVSTLDCAEIPVDYVLGATDAGPLKQIASVLNGSWDQLFIDVSPEQLSMIEGLRGLMSEPASVGTGFIDPRLRQIIWPTGDEASPWVALTPLQSSGLSDVIRTRLIAESAASTDPKTGKSTISRANAILGIGGSNPQNVGRYVRSMQRPLVFSGPTESKEIRTAYRLHFKGHLGGLAFAAPKKETTAFALWRRALQQSNGGSMPTGMDIRQAEREHIQSIAVASLNAAAEARMILDSNREHLNGLTSPSMDPFLRALIDPEQRDRSFKKVFARKLISSIERFKYRIGKDDYVVCGDGELAALISYAEEVSL
jgi:hypothetical protein